MKQFGQNELNFPAYNLMYFAFLSLNTFFLFSTFSLLMTLRKIANTGDGHLMCKRYCMGPCGLAKEAMLTLKNKQNKSENSFLPGKVYRFNP